MAQSPEENPSTTEIIRYDLGWKAINSLLRSGRSLSGHERNCCFLNTGGKRFADVSAAAGLDFIDDGRVVALSDWDYDGDVDFWIANRSGPQIRYLRNDVGRQNHFVALALEGVRSNRDAIGARVTVLVSGSSAKTPSKQSRTRRAGEGYLSQSSKWLHFGLGDAQQIDQVVVRWPSGTDQAFEGLALDRWYRLTEDRAHPELWTPPTTSIKPLVTSQLVAPAVSDQARIVLLRPMPLPELTYLDNDGNEQSLTSASQDARLVNLWATWCKPCLEELGEWREHAADFDAAGLRIVTVNVDEDNGTGSQMKKVEAVLKALRLPFEHGFGADDLAIKFDVLQRSLLSRERPLPVPSSFLIDRDGRLRVVYKGPVTVDTFLQDTRLLEADRAEILASAAPFPGRWLSPPGGSTPLQLALKFLEGGFAQEAKRYIRALIGQRETHPEYLSSSLLNLYGAIFVDQQQFQPAAAAFAESLKLEPGNRQAHMELGAILLRFGKGDQAAPHFEEVLKANPNDPELLYKLGLAHLQQGRFTEAERHMRRSTQLRPHPVAHWQLGNIYVALRKAKPAIEEYERALKLNPELTVSANNLAWLLATSDDDSLRDGPRALQFAQQICSSEQRRTPGNLDTLAAAHAEAGQFENAVRAASQAIELASQDGNEGLATRIRQRLALYKSGKPFRESLGP